MKENAPCPWCGAPTQDIGVGSYPPVRVLHCTKCHFEDEYVSRNEQKIMTNIQPFVFPFDAKKYRHVLLKREGMWCLVERTNLLTGGLHWEVVKLLVAQAVTFPNGTGLPERETYPSSGTWGIYGFTYTDLSNAEEKFNSINEDPRCRMKHYTYRLK